MPHSKVALITGASSGIGEALAREFARRGYSLVLAARREDRLRALAAELTQGDRRAIACRCDVTTDGDLEAVVARAKAELGRVDVVIANAGFGVVGTVRKLGLDDYRRQFETNIFGVIRTARAALPELERTGGSFAAIGSVTGYIALAGNTPYSMSKFAVRAFCDGLWIECQPLGVSVTHVAPGFVDSEIRSVNNQGERHAATPDPIPSWLRVGAAPAAREIASAVLARRREVVVTGHGKVLVWVKRHFPWLVFLLMKRFGISSRREPVESGG